MIAFTALTTLALTVSSVLALPSFPRQAGDTKCSDLGSAGFDTGGPYTLLAVKKSDPKDPGVPLVLGPPIGGPPFEDPGALGMLTADTFPDHGYSEFSLSKGFLSSNNGTSTAYGKFVYYAGPVGFDTEQVYSWDIFCGLAGTSAAASPPGPALTVYNSPDDFSLCQSTSAEFDGPLNALILRPENDTAVPLYDFDTCYGVTIYLVSV